MDHRMLQQHIHGNQIYNHRLKVAEKKEPIQIVFCLMNQTEY